MRRTNLTLPNFPNLRIFRMWDALNPVGQAALFNIMDDAAFDNHGSRYETIDLSIESVKSGWNKVSWFT